MVVFSVKPLFSILIVSLTLLLVLALLSPPYPFSQNQISGEPSLYASQFQFPSVILGSTCHKVLNLATGHFQYVTIFFIFFSGYWFMNWWCAEGKWIYGVFGDLWNGDLAIGGYKGIKQVPFLLNQIMFGSTNFQLWRLKICHFEWTFVITRFIQWKWV